MILFAFLTPLLYSVISLRELSQYILTRIIRSTDLSFHLLITLPKGTSKLYGNRLGGKSPYPRPLAPYLDMECLESLNAV